MRIVLDRQLKSPMYMQIAGQVRRAILLGDLVEGAVLPSERRLAEELGVHRNTVIRAYEQLKDMDLIESHQGLGYRVTGPLRPDAEPAETPRGGGSVNWPNLIKDEYLDLDRGYDNIYRRFNSSGGISMAAGVPPYLYTSEEIGEMVKEALETGAMLPAYVSPYQGDQELLKQIRFHLRNKGIYAGPSQIQILSETNQALDFIITALIEPGDAVIIEEPCSPDVYRLMELAGCRIFTVPVDGDGMMTDGLEKLVTLHDPKFIYVNSSYQDPTTAVLSMERRRAILDISRRYRLPVVEDDAASGLHYEDREMPTLKSMDRENNVIYIYSFSLTFIPGMSVAFVVADEQMIQTMSKLVSVHVISVNWLTQRLIARALEDGSYHSHLDLIIQHNRSNRDIMCSWLDRIGDIGVQYVKPRGGVYIWVHLPRGVTADDVVREAAGERVSVMPGQFYYPLQNSGHEYIRLNFSYESPEWLTEGMKRLTGVIYRLFKKTPGALPQPRAILVP